MQRVDYLLDARRFETIIEGPTGVPRQNEQSYQMGSWQDPWAHASMRTLRSAIDGPTDLAYVRMAYQRE